MGVRLAPVESTPWKIYRLQISLRFFCDFVFLELGAGYGRFVLDVMFVSSRSGHISYGDGVQ